MNTYYFPKTASYFKLSKKLWNFNNSVIKTKKSEGSKQLPCLIDQIAVISLKTPIQIANKLNNQFANLKFSEISDCNAASFLKSKI